MSGPKKCVECGEILAEQEGKVHWTCVTGGLVGPPGSNVTLLDLFAMAFVVGRINTVGAPADDLASEAYRSASVLVKKRREFLRSVYGK